ncbi:MAG: hypothetical protein LBE27_05510, partial [Deltaproteobacteria bacterium]|nr:hypothetical protein [Deltaproteobacteria bacterium]
MKSNRFVSLQEAMELLEVDQSLFAKYEKLPGFPEAMVTVDGEVQYLWDNIVACLGLHANRARMQEILDQSKQAETPHSIKVKDILKLENDIMKCIYRKDQKRDTLEVEASGTLKEHQTRSKDGMSLSLFFSREMEDGSGGFSMRLELNPENRAAQAMPLFHPGLNGFVITCGKEPGMELRTNSAKLFIDHLGNLHVMEKNGSKALSQLPSFYGRKLTDTVMFKPIAPEDAWTEFWAEDAEPPAPATSPEEKRPGFFRRIGSRIAGLFSRSKRREASIAPPPKEKEERLPKVVTTNFMTPKTFELENMFAANLEPVMAMERAAESEPELETAMEPEPDPELETAMEHAAETELETVMDNAAVPELETVMDNAAVPELEMVMDNAAETELETVMDNAAEPELEKAMKPEEEPELE